MPNPASREKIDICLLHLDRLTALKGERVAVKEMRKHIAWFLKGLYGGGKIRACTNECESRDELVTILNDYVEKVEQRQKEKLAAKAV